MRQLSLTKWTAQGQRACRMCGELSLEPVCVMACRALSSALYGCHCQGYIYEDPASHLEVCWPGFNSVFHRTLLHFTLQSSQWYSYSLIVSNGNRIQCVPKVMGGLEGQSLGWKCSLPFEFQHNCFLNNSWVPRHTVIVFQFFLYFNADWSFQTLGKWRVMGLKKTSVTLDLSAVGLESDHMNSDDLSGTPRVTCVCYFFLNCKHCEVCAVSTLCPQFQLLPVSTCLWSCEGRVGSWWWPCYPIGKWNTCGINNGQFLLANQKLLKDLLTSLLTSLLL